MAADAAIDEDLVARARDGDRYAVDAIYRRHLRYITGMTQRLVRDRSAAEDIVQDTFVTLLEKLDDLRDGGALRAWLARIAVRLVRRCIQRRRFLGVFGLDRSAGDATLELLASDAVSPETRAELAKLDRVLQALPSEQRLAWLLRYAEGYNLEEVAFACSCSPATAKRRIAAADSRVRLHVTLKEQSP